MNLNKKKELIARTLGVGKGRILLNPSSLNDIRESLTHQDVRDLYSQGAIIIKPSHGRRVVKKRTNRRRAGSVKKKVKPGKSHYVKLVRKLRAYLVELKKQGRISREHIILLRKEMKASRFKNKSQFKERLEILQKVEPVKNLGRKS